MTVNGCASATGFPSKSTARVIAKGSRMVSAPAVVQSPIWSVSSRRPSTRCVVGVSVKWPMGVEPANHLETVEKAA